MYLPELKRLKIDPLPARLRFLLPGKTPRPDDGCS
jgi:hypothetical protein